MIAVRKSLLLAFAALALMTSLSGCIVAERPGMRDNHWHNGWQGDNNQGGHWNHYR